MSKDEIKLVIILVVSFGIGLGFYHFKNKPPKQNEIYVEISGAVLNPGYLKLQSGDKLIHAIEKAKLSPDADWEAIHFDQVLENQKQYQIPSIKQ